MVENLILYEVTVYWPEPAGVFVMGIDCVDKRMSFFSQDDVASAIVSIDLSSTDSVVPHVLDFAHKAIFTTMILAMKMLQKQDFPDVASHANCVVNILMKRLH